MSDLFNTEEKRKLAIEGLTSLLQHPGWKLIEQIIGENIKIIESQLLDGVEDETLEITERLRDKLRVHKDVLDTPKTMIKSFTDTPEGEEPSLDPYHNKESLKKEREKAV